jgi:hypothetical protein
MTSKPKTLVTLTLAEMETLALQIACQQQACTNELDCPCPACDTARQARVARGSRPRYADQPWRPR